MTNNERLLMPRYLVIADYPGSEFRVGDILVYIKEFMHRLGGKVGSERHSEVFKGGNALIYASQIDKYPNLFRKLEWWEHRKPEEMPEYVKDPQGGIQRANYGKDNFGNQRMFLQHSTPFMVSEFMQGYLPATFEEYTEYQSQTKIK